MDLNINFKKKNKKEKKSICKSLIDLEYAKVILNLKLHTLLGSNFTNLNLIALGNEIIVRINIFSPEEEVRDPAKQMQKKAVITSLCRQVIGWYCTFKVNILINITQKENFEDPAYYYRLLLSKSKDGKISLFNTLSKLEKIRIPYKLKGVFIRVKGKRGARKDKKNLILGSPNKHTNKKHLMIQRNYTLNTSLGVYGIKITVVKKDFDYEY